MPALLRNSQIDDAVAIETAVDTYPEHFGVLLQNPDQLHGAALKKEYNADMIERVQQYLIGWKPDARQRPRRQDAPLLPEKPKAIWKWPVSM